MRVDLRSYGLEPPEKGKADRTGQAAKPAPEGGTRPEGTDQAQFSSDPARVRSLAAHALALPEVRSAKVEALQQAIAKKEYAVSNRQIADAIVAEHTGGASARTQSKG